MMNWYLFPPVESLSGQIPPPATDIGNVKLQIQTMLNSSLFCFEFLRNGASFFNVNTHKLCYLVLIHAFKVWTCSLANGPVSHVNYGGLGCKQATASLRVGVCVYTHMHGYAHACVCGMCDFFLVFPHLFVMFSEFSVYKCSLVSVQV